MGSLEAVNFEAGPEQRVHTVVAKEERGQGKEDKKRNMVPSCSQHQLNTSGCV